MKTNTTSTSARGCPRGVRRRRGSALVELAICLPVMLLIIYGAMEAAGMIFLRQALVQSAYEAAKVAAKTGDSFAATEAALDVADGRGVDQLTIDFSPSDVESAPRGQVIVVTLEAPGDQSSPFPLGLFRGLTVGARAVMVKE
jgi:hypothetical protein